MSETSLGALRVSLGLDSAQFTQSVADINRRLKVVKSEFEAVSDGTKEYAQSLDGLKAKNEMFNRQLQLQQEKAIQLKRNYDDLVKTKGKDAKETQNALIQYNKALGAMNKTETQIRRVSDALEEQVKKSNKAGQGLKDFGDKAKNIGGTLIGTLTPALVGLGAGMLKVADDVKGSTSRIQATLGITRDEAEKLSSTARSMWKDGFGENIEEVEQGILNVKQNMTDLNKADLEQVTKNALTLASVMGADINEVTRAGQNLMKGFGVDSKKAFDLMAWGGQNGLNFSQEMFDNLSEYAPLYKRMGFSAEEYFQLLDKGSKSGVYNLDYINDAMKEFQIRAKDGSKATTTAMGQLSESTQRVFTDFNNGKATVKDLHNAVIKDLKGMDDQVLANQIGVGLYGTKFEDLESDSMYALGNINGSIKNLDGAMKRSGENVDKTFGEKLQIAWRNAQDGLLPLGERLLSIAEKVIPKMTNAIKDMTQWWDGLSPAMKDFTLILGGIATVAPPVILAVGSIATAIGGMMPIITGITGAVAGGAGLTAGVGGLGVALGLLSNPITITVGALAGLGIGFALLDKEMDKPVIKSNIFSDKISESTQKAIGSYMTLESDATTSLNRLVWSQTTLTQKMADDLVAKYKAMGDRINQTLDTSYQERTDKLTTYFATNDALSAQEEAKIIANMQIKNGKKKEEIQKYENQVQAITQKAVDQKRALSEKERQQIAEITIKMQRTAVATMSKSAEEQLLIQGRLKNQSGIITAEQSAKTVRESKKARDGAVKEAEKKYKDEVAQYEYARDVTGTMTTKQANKTIKEAKRAKDETVAKAKLMHEGVVSEAQKQAKGHSNKVDWENGQVLSKWDNMYNGILKVSNWIKGLFGIEQDKPRGTVKESNQQKIKRQNAEFKAYANGTPNGTHAGGMALVGEEGAELAHIPNVGTTILGVGGQELVNLPKGTSVLPHRHTKQVMKQYGIPMYADGVGNYFDTFLKGSGAVWDLVKKKFNITDNFPTWSKSMTGNPLDWAGGLLKKWMGNNTDLFNFGADSGSFKGGAVAPSQVKSWVIKALQLTNTPLSWLPAMLVKAQKESGYNPKAINLWDSNAKKGIPSKGLFQTIDPTFNSYKMKGMNDIYNPIHNAVAAIRYIKARYGSVFNTPGIKSMANGGGYVGYAKGGLITREHMAVVGEKNKREMVIPLEQHSTRARDLWKQAGIELGMLQAPTPSVPNVASGVNTNAIGSTNNVNNNYNIYVEYKGNTSDRDIVTLAKKIKEQIEILDIRNNRMGGVL